MKSTFFWGYATTLEADADVHFSLCVTYNTTTSFWWILGEAEHGCKLMSVMQLRSDSLNACHSSCCIHWGAVGIAEKHAGGYYNVCCRWELEIMCGRA